MKLAINIFKLP